MTYTLPSGEIAFRRSVWLRILGLMAFYHFLPVTVILRHFG